MNVQIRIIRANPWRNRGMSRLFLSAYSLLILILTAPALAQTSHENPLPTTSASHTQIVLLGTGTPRADPQRSGPATAIVVNDTAYLVDVGPGIVRRAAAAYDKGIKGLAVPNLQTAFITHLHSAHTVGYPDLIFTTWVQGRHGPLKVYGPTGLQAMTK